MKILIAHVNMYKGYSKKDSKPTQNPTNYNAKDDTSSVANAQKSIIADLTDNGNNTTIGKTANDVVAAFKQAIDSGKYTNTGNFVKVTSSFIDKIKEDNPKLPIIIFSYKEKKNSSIPTLK